MFLSNLGISAVATSFCQLANMLFWILVAKYVGEEKLGALTIILGSSLLFVQLSELILAVIIQKNIKLINKFEIIPFSFTVTSFSVVFYFLVSIAIYLYFDFSIPILFLGLLTTAFGVYQAMLRSQVEATLDFKLSSKVELVCAVFSFIAFIVLFIYLDFSFVSCMFYFLFGYLSRALVYSFNFRRFMVFRFSGKEVMFSVFKLYGFFKFTLTNTYVRNVDNYFVGVNYSLASLGVYSICYKIMLAPVSRISGVIAKVLFPTLNRKPLKSSQFPILSHLFKIVFLFSFSMMLILYTNRGLVGAFFGFSDFELFNSLLFWLSMSGSIQAMCSLFHVVLISKGKEQLLSRVSDFYFLLFTISFTLTFFVDINQYVVAYFASTVFYFIYYYGKVLGAYEAFSFRSFSFYFVWFLIILLTYYYEVVVFFVAPFSMLVGMYYFYRFQVDCKKFGF